MERPSWVDLWAVSCSLPFPSPSKSGIRTAMELITIRPLDKDYYSNQQIPPGILLGLSSSSKGIKDSNGHTAILTYLLTLTYSYTCLLACLLGL